MKVLQEEDITWSHLMLNVNSFVLYLAKTYLNDLELIEAERIIECPFKSV